MPKYGVVAIFIAGLILTGCGQKTYRTIPGYPKPYKVLGKWYQPIPDAKGFTQKGRASWYGKKFHGRKTANGEIYNMYAVTAAHKTLPLGTWVRVKNLENGRHIDVRVNDRGPFVSGRIIDLSYTAAKAIDMTKHGTARVKLTAISPPATVSKKKTVVSDETGRFSVQAGSFSEKENARRFMATLSKTYRDVHLVKEGGVYKVRVGEFSTRNGAESTKSALKGAGYPAFTVQE